VVFVAWHGGNLVAFTPFGSGKRLPTH
jgi:hypothetical protein